MSNLKRLLVVFAGYLIVYAIATATADASTTAYTCVEGTSGSRFSDPDCKNLSSTGSYNHVQIAEGTVTILRPTATSNWVLSGELASAEVKLTATELSCAGCVFHNQTVAGVMTVVGSGGRILFKHVTTNIPHCGVKEPSFTEIGTVTTEQVEVTATSTLGFSIKPVPLVTPLLAVVHFVNSGGTCPIAGAYSVEGTVFASASGADISVNTGPEETLTFGEEPASLSGTATLGAGEAGPFTPVGLT